MQSGLVETTDHGGAAPSTADSAATDSDVDGPVMIFRSENGHEFRITALDLLLVLSALSALGIGTAVASAAVDAARTP